MKKGAFSLALAAFGLLAVAFLTSCGGGSVEFYPLKRGGSTVFGPPKNPSEVQIFITKKPDFPYEERISFYFLLIAIARYFMRVTVVSV